MIRILLLTLALTTAAEPLQAAEGTVLITGANRGIGLALARKFSKEGYDVIGTARKPDEAIDLKETGARVVQLDVAQQASVDAMAAELKDVPIDIVINNAGIAGHSSPELATLTVDNLGPVLNINTLGPLRVTQALLDNVMASDRKLVVNISSMMGSMELNTFGCCLGYRASKAALNSITVTLAVNYKDEDIAFVTMHPGYVQTDMNEGRGEISPLKSAAGIYRVIKGLDKSDSGKFYDNEGNDMPW
jgi:NAD(P)-dependent dehydrogenase (short-subunit alcohol dehydrogenase family)